MSFEIDLDEPIMNYLLDDVVRADYSDSIVDVAKVMRDLGIGLIVVTKGGQPIGLITERSIIYDVVASGRDPSSTQLDSVMSSPIPEIKDSSTLGAALTQMSKLGMQMLAVVTNGRIIGFVTQKVILALDDRQHIPLPELSKAETIRCPYCSHSAKNKKDLSSHIDWFHVDGETRRREA